MNKIIFPIACMFSAMAFIACENEDEFSGRTTDSTDPSSPQKEILITTETVSANGNDFALLDAADSILMIGKYVEGTQRLSRLDCVDGLNILNYTFYEDGTLESVVSNADSLALFFSNYENGTVDVLVSYGEELNYYEDVACDLSAGGGSAAHRARVAKGPFFEDDKDMFYYFSDLFLDLGELATFSNLNQALADLALHHTHILQPLMNETLQTAVTAADFCLSTTKFLGLLTAGAAVSTASSVFITLSAIISSYQAGEMLGELITSFFVNIYDAMKGYINSGIGSLKVTLSWNFLADIDLHAYEPNGTHIYWLFPYSHKTGGYLDVDNTVGGTGAIENIYWENPEEGVYRFYLHYFGGFQSGTCTASVTYKGHGRTYTVPMTEGSVENFANQNVNRYNITPQDVDNTMVMDIIIESAKKDKDTEPIVVFHRMDQ